MWSQAATQVGVDLVEQLLQSVSFALQQGGFLLTT